MSRQRFSRSCTTTSDTAVKFAPTQSGSTAVSYGRSTTSTYLTPRSTLTLSTFLSLENETSDFCCSYGVVRFLRESTSSFSEYMNKEFLFDPSTASLDHASASCLDQFEFSGPENSPENLLTHAGPDVGVQNLQGEFGNELGNELETDQEILGSGLDEAYALMIQSISPQSSNSLVFNHLKVLLSELNIPDNDSPKYHVAWAFDPPFSKPKPGPAFDDMALELNHIRTMRTMLGEDLKARINKLRSGRKIPRSSVILSTVTNQKLSSRSSYTSRPFWSIIRPVKASTLVNAITVCRRVSGAKFM